MKITFYIYKAESNELCLEDYILEEAQYSKIKQYIGMWSSSIPKEVIDFVESEIIAPYELDRIIG